MGRKYGRLAYGRYSYDLWPATWIPIPPPIIGEIWVPETAPSPIDIWASTTAAPTEFWAPVEPAVSAWNSTTVPPVEIWKPVVFPELGPQINGR